MKKTTIELGKCYTDGKGAIRKVIGMGPQFKSFLSQEDTDCVRYKLLAKKRGPHAVNSENNTTRTAFAAWAKSEVLESFA